MYLDCCSHIFLYFPYNSTESSSLQYPILLRTIRNFWCGSVILPGRGSSDISTGSWEYPFWKCRLPMSGLFCVSSEPICSKWPGYCIHEKDRIPSHYYLDHFKLIVLNRFSTRFIILHTSKIQQTVQQSKSNWFLNFLKLSKSIFRFCWFTLQRLKHPENKIWEVNRYLTGAQSSQ